MTRLPKPTRSRAMADAYRAGETQRAIAARFGVAVSTVCLAVKAHGLSPTKMEAITRRTAAAQTPHARAKRAESLRRPLADRFYSKAVVGDGCWGWRGAKDGNGYAQMREAGRNVKASHIALLLDGRPQPTPGLCALHTCDNPECTNPNHLWWGTRKENTQDALAKGRLDLSGLALGRAIRNGTAAQP